MHIVEHPRDAIDFERERRRRVVLIQFVVAAGSAVDGDGDDDAKAALGALHPLLILVLVRVLEHGDLGVDERLNADTLPMHSDDLHRILPEAEVLR